MNELKAFENPEFGRVRTVSVDNEPWFFAKDVCDALSIATNHVRESLDEDEVSNLRSTEIGPEFGGKAPLIVSEAGLYSLILKSRKPEAKAFKRWITHDVIPAIRKTGGYQVPQSPAEQMAQGILAAQKLLAERDATIAKQNEQIAVLTPKGIFADAVTASRRPSSWAAWPSSSSSRASTSGRSASSRGCARTASSSRAARKRTCRRSGRWT